MKRTIMEALATGFYSGRLPWAPGTMGTIVAIPLVLLMSFLSPVAYMVVTLGLIGVSVAAAQWYEKFKGEHDSSEIVIDEIVGYVVAMTWLPMTWQCLTLAFLLFRLLDIFKPFPIGYLDRNVGGGFGVVIDDVLAGLVANVILQVVFINTNWLGQQWVKVSGIF